LTPLPFRKSNHQITMQKYNSQTRARTSTIARSDRFLRRAGWQQGLELPLHPFKLTA
jgi:hypothetical protein